MLVGVVVTGFLSGWSWSRVEQAWRATATYPQSDKLACTAMNTFWDDAAASKPVPASTERSIIRYGQKAADLTIQEATFHLGQAIKANSSAKIENALKDYETECNSLGLGLKKSNAS